MKKSKNKFFKFISMFLLITLAFFAFNEFNQYKSNKIKNNKYKKVDNIQSNILARVGNKDITNYDIDEFKLLKGKNLNSKKILNKVIEEEVLYQKAKNSNIKVSEDEVKNIIVGQKEITNKNKNGEDFKRISAILKFKNISLDEYWSSVAPTIYYKNTMINRMIRKINEEIYININKNYDDWTQEQVQNLYKKLYKEKLESLKKEFSVVIY